MADKTTVRLLDVWKMFGRCAANYRAWRNACPSCQAGDAIFVMKDADGQTDPAEFVAAIRPHERTLQRWRNGLVAPSACRDDTQRNGQERFLAERGCREELSPEERARKAGLP